MKKTNPGIISVEIVTPTIELFENTPWWRRLNQSEQEFVWSKSQKLFGIWGKQAGLLKRYGQMKLEAGEVLLELKNFLEGKRAFDSYVKTLFPFSERTAWRRVELKEEADELPPAILDVMFQNNVEVDNIMVKTIKKLGPAPNISEEDAVGVVMKAVEIKRARKSRKAKITLDALLEPEPIEVECALYLDFLKRWEGLQALPYKKKANVINNLCGYYLWHLGGIGHSIPIAPQHPPTGEQWQLPKRGRPPIKAQVVTATQ